MGLELSGEMKDLKAFVKYEGLRQSQKTKGRMDRQSGGYKPSSHQKGYAAKVSRRGNTPL